MESRVFIPEYDELTIPTTEGSPEVVVEPLDLALTKKMLRFGSSSEDVLIEGWITAARELFETLTGRQLITATRVYALDGFPTDGIIELPSPPLRSVTSVVYGTDDTTFDSDSYFVTTTGTGPHAPRGRVTLPDGGSWPTLTPYARGVRITYVAGYGDSYSEIPALIQSVLYELVRRFHARSDEGLPAMTRLTIDNLMYSAAQTIRPWRTSWLP